MSLLLSPWVDWPFNWFRKWVGLLPRWTGADLMPGPHGGLEPRTTELGLATDSIMVSRGHCYMEAGLGPISMGVA